MAINRYTYKVEQVLERTLRHRLNKTHVDWDGDKQFFCIVVDDEFQSAFLFAVCSSMERADEACAKRQGWTLEQYYNAIRADMKVGGW